MNVQGATYGTCGTGPELAIGLARQIVQDGLVRSPPSGCDQGSSIDLARNFYDRSYHDTDWTGAAFQTAAALAFHQAAKNAEPAVLESLM